MNLISWEPFRELMPSALRRWPALSDDVNGNREWAPSADISETDKEYLIRAELPSVKKEDIKVAIENGMISIEGERKYGKEEKNERFHRVESVQGKFARSFILPEDVDENAVHAQSKDGVLTVHVPKSKVVKSPSTQVKVR